MMMVIIFIIPYGLLVVETGMNLNWALWIGLVLTTPFLVPIFMTILWSRTTGVGVVTGIIPVLPYRLFYPYILVESMCHLRNV